MTGTAPYKPLALHKPWACQLDTSVRLLGVCRLELCTASSSLPAVTADCPFLPVCLQYIALLRKCKMQTRLDAARQAMQARFPLPEGMWLAWLGDELAGKLDVERILELFALAVQDYLSVPVWAMYLK